MKETGKLIISLDFELLWGVRDKKTIATYGKNILGVWDALPNMLALFEEYQIRATFASVGLLFAANKAELVSYCPQQQPQYTDSNLSPYTGHFDQLPDQDDPYHYAHSLVELLAQYPNQEIATHTFSHYYCLENGQTASDFRADMEAAIAMAKAKGITLNSLVFPRNQFNDDYLRIIQELGITAYRGNEKSWFYKAAKGTEEKLYKRAFRLLDAYLNISGANSYTLAAIKQKQPYNMPSSRFLRPYSTKLKALEPLRMRRILSSMSYAAKNNQVYHLWWHPHNFGAHQEENFKVLKQILEHYALLNAKYGFESLTMHDLSEKLNNF